MPIHPRFLLTTIALLMSQPISASEPSDPLKTQAGDVVTNTEEWRTTRRPEILKLFREQVYGVRPVGKLADFEAVVLSEDAKALDGTATRKEIGFRYSGPGGKGGFQAVLYIPNQVKAPAPAFVVINFDDPDPATDKNRGGYWPVKEIISRGYATASFNFNSVDPDKTDGFKDGVRAVFSKEPLATDAWGALSAWGWGASRVMDYLETDKAIDAKHVAVIGHSRAGKAALWCGAEDQRFAMVISNNSGSGGAALSRGKKGERVAEITKRFPYWFCANYAKYANREDELPIDQHELLALIAPRPLYVASATEDEWADPSAEFKSAVLAGPVYRLLGKTGLESDTRPAPDQAMTGGGIAYHIRTGKHAITVSDWQHYLDFADLKWAGQGAAETQPSR